MRRSFYIAVLVSAMIACRPSALDQSGLKGAPSLQEQCKEYLNEAGVDEQGNPPSETFLYQGVFESLLASGEIPLTDAQNTYYEQLKYWHFQTLQQLSRSGLDYINPSQPYDKTSAVLKLYVTLLDPSLMPLNPDAMGATPPLIVNSKLGSMLYNTGQHGRAVLESNFDRWAAGLSENRGIAMDDLFLLHVAKEHGPFLYNDRIDVKQLPWKLGEIYSSKTTPSVLCNNAAAGLITQDIPWDQLGMEHYTGFGYVSWFHGPIAQFQHNNPVISSLIPIFGTALAAGDALLTGIEGRNAQGHDSSRWLAGFSFLFEMTIGVFEVYGAKAAVAGVRNMAKNTASEIRSIQNSRQITPKQKVRKLRDTLKSRLSGRLPSPCGALSLATRNLCQVRDFKKPVTKAEVENIEATLVGSNDKYFFHYSNEAGMAEINASAKLVPGDHVKRLVYVTDQDLKPQDVVEQLFLNLDSHQDRGNFVVIFKQPTSGFARTSDKVTSEFTHVGSFSLRPEDVLYIGPNPFN